MDYEKNGRTFTFTLDTDLIADEEESNPGYSFTSDLDAMSEGEIKFSVLRRLARFIGTDFKTMKADGLNYADLIEIFKGCIEELGFTSDKPGSNIS